MSESLNSDQQQQLLFMMLLQQHEQIAMMGLGKLKSPMSDTVERDLSSAKYAIDTLVMLEKFTNGNLSKELSGYLTQMLTNLRLNYADEKKKDAVGAPKTDASSESASSDASEGGGSEDIDSPKKGEGPKSEEGSTKGGTSGDAGSDAPGGGGSESASSDASEADAPEKEGK